MGKTDDPCEDHSDCQTHDNPEKHNDSHMPGRRRQQMSFEDQNFDPVAYINDRFPDGVLIRCVCLFVCLLDYYTEVVLNVGCF